MQKKFIYLMFILLILSVIGNVLLHNSNNTLMSMNINAINYMHHLENVSGIGRLGSTHIHADFKMYVSGNLIDFSSDRYQLRNKFVHLEDGNGNAIHIHTTGITLEKFFNTLGIKIDKDCILFDKEYCSNGNNKLRYYINGGQISDINYLIKDNDQILISYGNYNEEELKKQIKSVEDISIKQGDHIRD